MWMLKLGAVYANECVRVSKENLSSSFDRTRFPCAGRTQEQQRADRAARSVEASLVDLINLGESSKRPLLPDHSRGKLALKLVRLARLGLVIENSKFGPNLCAGWNRETIQDG